MDKNITIVLVIKNLGIYTQRFVEYHLLSQNSPYKIVIADGGDDDNISSYLLNIQRERPDQLLYVKFKYDATLSDFHQKLFLIFPHIETPLCVFMSPDDFILFEGIHKSVEFLSLNPEFVSSRGSLRNVEVGGNKVLGNLNLLENMYSRFTDPIDKNFSSERVNQQMSQFHGNWHNVVRTKTMKCVFGLLSLSDPVNMRFTEQIQGSLVPALGKVYRGEYEYILIQTNPIEKVSIRTSHFMGQEQWVKSSFWPSDFASMAESVSAVISYLDKVPLDLALESFYESYLLKIPSLSGIIKPRIESSKGEIKMERVEKMLLMLEDIKPEQLEDLYPLQSFTGGRIEDVSSFLTR